MAQGAAAKNASRNAKSAIDKGDVMRVDRSRVSDIRRANLAPGSEQAPLSDRRDVRFHDADRVGRADDAVFRNRGWRRIRPEREIPEGKDASEVLVGVLELPAVMH